MIALLVCVVDGEFKLKFDDLLNKTSFSEFIEEIDKLINEDIRNSFSHDEAIDISTETIMSFKKQKKR